MTQMAAMPIYGKNPLKLFFSGTVGLMALSMLHLGNGPNEVGKNYNLWLTLTFFKEMSNFLT